MQSKVHILILPGQLYTLDSLLWRNYGVVLQLTGKFNCVIFGETIEILDIFRCRST